MQAERYRYLQAEKNERIEVHKGHVYGYKTNTIRTCMSVITFSTPQGEKVVLLE
jgi:hypothetical protein